MSKVRRGERGTMPHGRIPLKDVMVSELNPRYGAKLEVGELGKSVKRDGLLQPITLRASTPGKYEVLLGSRRFLALVEERGTDGFLENGEYMMVDWDDQFVVRAAVAENEQREDLSVVDMGRFLNRYAERDPKLKDDDLVSLTGVVNRARVNEMRALADRFEHLPAEWQAELLLPDNRRPGHRSTITLTHFKHIRKFLDGDGSIRSDVRDLMVKAAVKHWPATELKRQVKDLGEKPDAAPPKKPGRSKTDGPAYMRIKRCLTTAVELCGSDEVIAALIRAVASRVEEKIAASEVKSGESGDASKAPAPSNGTPEAA